MNGLIGHFESVAKVNGWDDAMCLLWLEVRMTGKAQNAWRRLTQEAKAQYPTAKCALRKRFEPDSIWELYAVEFQTRRHQQGESWVELADNLRLLADKAFPNLEEPAKEQLLLDRYLSLLDRPQLALAVTQKHPKMMDDAAAFTLEVESYLTLPVVLSNQQQVSPVSEVPRMDNVSSAASVAAIHTQQRETIIKMLSAFNTRLDQLETAVYKGNQPSQQLRNDSHQQMSRPCDMPEMWKGGPLC